eukprot:SAG31_NODE_1663_length_7581_cov_10.076399_1_plen_292_part_00
MIAQGDQLVLSIWLGVFLFIFTSAIPWRLEEMATEQRYVVQFFGYAAAFVVIGLIAFNLLIRTPVVTRELNKDEEHHEDAICCSSEAVLTTHPGAASKDSQLTATLASLKQTWWSQSGMVALWICLLSVQSLFGRTALELQEPLMYVNLFGLLCGIQGNIWLGSCLAAWIKPHSLASFIFVVMPGGVALMACYAFDLPFAATSPAPLVIGLVAAYFVCGGLCWMQLYTVTLDRLPAAEDRTEATRLLNLGTQIGILFGIAFSLLLLELEGSTDGLEGSAASGVPGGGGHGR